MTLFWRNGSRDSLVVEGRVIDPGEVKKNDVNRIADRLARYERARSVLL